MVQLFSHQRVVAPLIDTMGRSLQHFDAVLKGSLALGLAAEGVESTLSMMTDQGQTTSRRCGLRDNDRRLARDGSNCRVQQFSIMKPKILNKNGSVCCSVIYKIDFLLFANAYPGCFPLIASSPSDTRDAP